MTNGTRRPELITAFFYISITTVHEHQQECLLPTPCSSNFKSAFVFFARGPARRETRVHTRAQNTTFEPTIIAKFVTSGRTPSTLDVRTLCCMCEPLETARSRARIAHLCVGLSCGWVESLAGGQVFEQERGRSVNVRPRPIANQHARFSRDRERRTVSRVKFHDKTLWEDVLAVASSSLS